MLYIVNSGTMEAIEAYHKVEPSFVLEDNPSLLTSKGGTEYLIDLLHRKSVVGQTHTVVSNIDLRKSAYFFDLWGGSTFCFLDKLTYSLGVVGEGIHVFSKDFYRYILSDTCHQFVEMHLYRLAFLKEDPRNILEPLNDGIS